MDLISIEENLRLAIDTLLDEAKLDKNQAVVLGGSTSEVVGESIGTATNLEVSSIIVKTFIEKMKENNLYPVVQCCEHLNRALVVEREYAEKYDIMPVNVVPVGEAGGGFATSAMKKLSDPVVIEHGHRIYAGIDIGDSFIGMHIDRDRVGVVVRSNIKEIGKAHLSMIRTRDKLIGGKRAKYY